MEQPRFVVLDDWTDFWAKQPAVERLRQRGEVGAGMDVFDREPLPTDHPLAKLDNVVLTPHIGWGVGDNFGLMVQNLTNAVITYLDGDMSGVVNPAALERRSAWATKG
jgi:phosphoglycerate dehydrogenase-like enzyme